MSQTGCKITQNVPKMTSKLSKRIPTLSQNRVGFGKKTCFYFFCEGKKQIIQKKNMFFASRIFFAGNKAGRRKRLAEKIAFLNGPVLGGKQKKYSGKKNEKKSLLRKKIIQKNVFFPTLPQNDRKMSPKLPKMSPKLPKMFRKCPNIFTKRSQNHHKMIPN